LIPGGPGIKCKVSGGYDGCGSGNYGMRVRRKRWKIVVLAADGRGKAQTFSSADLAEKNRLALRAGEMIHAKRSVGELRMVFYREAIADYSSAGRGAINPCSRMREHSAAVCVCLRVSAAKKIGS